MKKKLCWLLFLPALFTLSCERKLITDTDDIIDELEDWQAFLISPGENSTIEPYTEFRIKIDPSGYSAFYSESENNIWGRETYSRSGSQYFTAAIDSLFIRKESGERIPTEVSDSLEICYYGLNSCIVVPLPEDSYVFNTQAAIDTRNDPMIDNIL